MTWRVVRRTRSLPARPESEQAGQAAPDSPGFARQADRTGKAGPDGQRPRDSGPPPENAGWTIFSYLVAGMVAYGLIGWAASRVTHISVLIPVGALVGLIAAIIGIFVKYGRS